MAGGFAVVAFVSIRRPAYLRVACSEMTLRREDLGSILAFLADVELEEPFAPAFLERLRELIRCDEVVYQEYDARARRSCLGQGVGPDGPECWDSLTGEPPSPLDERYWQVGPCPIVSYRADTGTLEAVRMSDVIPTRRFRELPVYREYFRLLGLEHMLDLGLPERSARQRSLILFRAAGEHDFCERDRAVLEALRPHVYAFEAYAALRRQLAETLRATSAVPRGDETYKQLTQREREIAGLVAEGKTNAEIAEKLWVAPSTVKKHLEHIYGKLGVGRRAAVAAMHEAVHA